MIIFFNNYKLKNNGRFFIKFIIIFCIFLIISCPNAGDENHNSDNPKEESDDFFADTTLVQYGYEDLPDYTFSTPYVAYFEKGNTQLHFIASYHANDLNHPTFQTILSEFNTYSPDSTVVERLDSDMGISPQYYINRFSDINSVDGEPDYTIYLSVNSDPFVDFIAAEPSTNTVVSRILDYSIDGRQLDAYDYLYFAFMRRVNNKKEDGTILDQIQFENEFDYWITGIIDSYNMPIDPAPTYEEFLDIGYL